MIFLLVFGVVMCVAMVLLALGLAAMAALADEEMPHPEVRRP